MRAEPLQPGQVVAGRYRVEGLLGEGGMGSVYRAIQVSVDRPVALKVISESLSQYPQVVDRFQREGRLLARLRHPNTVCLYDFGATERGQPFIVMELLEGQDLGARLRQQGPISWPFACQICCEVLRSLEEAHRLGIVHRDIKPANLFLCTSGGRAPSVKVLDFGISGLAVTDAEMAKLTAEGAVIGSAPYMSPEQAQGKPITATTDLYSVGVVLFEMLTGRTLFEGDTRTALLLAKLSQPPPTLRQVRPDLQIPDELQALLAKLLVQEPARRLSSAALVAERLEELLRNAGEWRGPRSVAPGSAPVSARPGVGAQTEPMSFAQTAELLGANVTSRWRRYRPLALMALAPAALLCALGVRLALSWTAPETSTPVTELSPEHMTNALRREPSAPAPPVSLNPVNPVQPANSGSSLLGDKPVELQQQPAASRAAPTKQSANAREESVADRVEREQLASRERLFTQYRTIGEAIAARDAGEISTQQMNRVVRPLQRAEDDELARVGRVYKAGDMDEAAYKRAIAAIKAKYEGVSR